MNRREYARLGKAKDASKLKVGVVVANFNEDITEGLLFGAVETLEAWQVKEKNIEVLHVPGSFEVPFGCRTLLVRKKFDAIVALGCIIKGETKHDEYIANAVASGIMQLSLSYGVPVGFGVITTNDLKQAKARSTGATNKGREAAIAAMELALSLKHA